MSAEERTLRDAGEMRVLEFSERHRDFDLVIQSVFPWLKYGGTALTGIFSAAIGLCRK